jgi:hypothetical protein
MYRSYYSKLIGKQILYKTPIFLVKLKEEKKGGNQSNNSLQITSDKLFCKFIHWELSPIASVFLRDVIINNDKFDFEEYEKYRGKLLPEKYKSIFLLLGINFDPAEIKIVETIIDLQKMEISESRKFIYVVRYFNSEQYLPFLSRLKYLSSEHVKIFKEKINNANGKAVIKEMSIKYNILFKDIENFGEKFIIAYV